MFYILLSSVYLFYTYFLCMKQLKFLPLHISCFYNHLIQVTMLTNQSIGYMDAPVPKDINLKEAID